MKPRETRSEGEVAMSPKGRSRDVTLSKTRGFKGRPTAKLTDSRFRQIALGNWDGKRLERLLKKMSERSVLVVGDVGVDRYTRGVVERISPEAPVPIVRVEQESLKLGLAANVAENVRALGGKALLVGVVGKDRTAQDFSVLLKSSGLSERHLVVDPSRRTVLKERVVSDRQQLLRIDYESEHPMHASVQLSVLKKAELALQSVDALIVEDYAKGLFSETLLQSLFLSARKQQKPALVDPNVKAAVSLYRGASLLTPNTREAEALAEVAIRDLDSLWNAGKTILERTNAEHLLITRGKEGMAVFSSAQEQVTLIPTAAREVYDVSGAGDTVISVLSLALASGSTLEEAAILGNLAAGVEVGKVGTATVSPEEVRSALRAFR